MSDSFDSPLARQLEELNKRKKAIKGKRMRRPKSTRVIAVSNQKGGVGKTTTTVNLSAAFADAGMRVLVVDIDPQGNASSALGMQNRDELAGTYEVLLGDMGIAEAIMQSPESKNLFCCPTNLDLAGAEVELVSMPNRELVLRDALNQFLEASETSGKRFDYVLIDCPPSLGLLTMNAMAAAKEVLVPMQTEYYALEGLAMLSKTVQALASAFNPRLRLSTILLTMVDRRTNLSREVAADIRDAFRRETLTAEIPRSIRIAEAPSHGMSVFEYEPQGTGATAYREAALEIAERGE